LDQRRFTDGLLEQISRIRGCETVSSFLQPSKEEDKRSTSFFGFRVWGCVLPRNLKMREQFEQERALIRHVVNMIHPGDTPGATACHCLAATMTLSWALYRRARLAVSLAYKSRYGLF